MSIIIGPFDPTTGSGQFTDQLYLQSGGYVIHNPTSYQLTLIKADSNRLIVDAGTVRVVHKVGGNAGNVEWTATLVGPLAILNTPGFTIEILQQGIDDIPDEAIVSLSQIATQEPRSFAVPLPSAAFSLASIVVTSPSADVVTTHGTVSYANSPVHTIGYWLYGIKVDGLVSSAAAGEFWVLSFALRLQQQQAGVNVGTPIQFMLINLMGVGPAMANPISIFPPNPIVQYKQQSSGADALLLQSVVHQSTLVAGHSAVFTVNLYFDVDLSNTQVAPGPGGGILAAVTPFSSQYTGAVY